MMNVFIVRPFGTKSGIDFDRVEAELVRPAIEQAGLTGGTTEQFIQQGNKRAFLIKSKTEPGADSEVPFDLKTDRYLSYDPQNPRGALDLLAAALKLTLDAQNADSPIYQLLP